jgi:hypothetical protein
MNMHSYIKRFIVCCSFDSLLYATHTYNTAWLVVGAVKGVRGEYSLLEVATAHGTLSMSRQFLIKHLEPAMSTLAAVAYEKRTGKAYPGAKLGMDIAFRRALIAASIVTVNAVQSFRNGVSDLLSMSRALEPDHRSASLRYNMVRAIDQTIGQRFGNLDIDCPYEPLVPENWFSYVHEAHRHWLRDRTLAEDIYSALGHRPANYGVGDQQFQGSVARTLSPLSWSPLAPTQGWNYPIHSVATVV